MTSHVVVYLVVFMVFTGLVGCEHSGDQSNGELVDRQYVNSENYRSFSSQADQEQEVARNRKVGLTARLKGLSDCSASRALTPPFAIDSLNIAKWSESDTTTCFSEQSFESSPYTLRVLAQTSFYDVKMLWILHTRVSMYRDEKLFLATFKNEKLRHAESVGAYRKNLKEHISTEMDVRPDSEELLITAVEDRKIIYPIEQHNAVENVYYVDSDGNIKK
ncbi:hypothetical protein [Fodinibius sp.]|uniref:hypothetical protein n=1 Tax=Fodinibius sp. TaxID=1872440 RepID=UPI0035693706